MRDSSDDDLSKAWEDNREKLVEMTKNCMLLNNFYWTVWCFMMIKDEECTDPMNFTWEFLEGRMAMIRAQLDRFGKDVQV